MITNGQFCYWDCKSDADAGILILISAFTLALLIYTTISYLRLTRIPAMRIQSHLSIRVKYLGILAWAIISILNTIFSIVVYSTQFRPVIQHTSITFYSRIYAFLQTMPAMIVQTLLLATAQTMITNGMAVLLDQQHQPTKDQMKLYKFISHYYRARYVFFIPWLLLLIPFSQPYVYEICTNIKIIMLMIDCLIIIRLLWFCHRYMMDKAERLLPNSRTDRDKLNKQTLRLIVCGACRFVMNLTFYIIFPLAFWIMSTKDNFDKPCLEQFKQHLQFSLGYLVLGTLLMHHLSIIVLLKMYKPSPNRSSLVRISEAEPINIQHP